MATTPARRRSGIARLVLTLAIPFLALSAGEFLISLLDAAPPRTNPIVIWNPARDRTLDAEDNEFRVSADWLWEPRPGVFVFGAPINEGAYRGPYYPPRATGAKPPPLRIATLGDSTTYAIALPEAQGWPRFLETLLRATGNDVEILNFGCVGFSAVQATALYEGRVRQYRPDVVIAAVGAVNDQFPTLRGQTDAEKIAWMNSFRRRLLLVLERLDLFRWIRGVLTGPPKQVSDFGPEDEVERVPLPEFEQTLERLVRDVEADGALLLFVLPPRRLDGESQYPKTLEYSAAIRTVARRHDIPLVEVHDLLREMELKELGEASSDPRAIEAGSLYIDPWHPSPKGHRAYAVVVGRALEGLGLVRRGN